MKPDSRGTDRGDGQHQEALNDAVDGGGCAEAWDAAAALRRQHAEDEGNGRSRRSVLKATALGGLTAVGLPVGAAEVGRAADAGPDPRRVEPQFRDVETVNRLFGTGAQDLLEALATHGYLDSADVAGLAAERFEPLSALGEQSDTAYYTVEMLRGPDGDPLHLELVTPVSGDGYTMRVRYRPLQDHGYAVLDEAERDVPTIVTAADDGVYFGHPSTYAYTYCSTKCDEHCGLLFCETDYWLVFVCRDGDTYYTCGRHCTEQCG